VDVFDQFLNVIRRVTFHADGRQGFQLTVARNDALFAFAEDEIFDAEKPPQDMAYGDGRNAYENQ
jgi:hypothetical protein